MPSDSRSRMMSFRLTAEEYQRFRSLCLLHGMRSVSELVRAGINLLLQYPDRVPEESLETRVTELEQRFHILALEVKRLQQTGSPGSPESPTLTFGESSANQ